MGALLGIPYLNSAIDKWTRLRLNLWSNSCWLYHGLWHHWDD